VNDGFLNRHFEWIVNDEFGIFFFFAMLGPNKSRVSLED